MRIKLPEGFGGISLDGSSVDLNPDADGCVDVEHEVAQALLAHGGTIAPDPVEANAAIDAEAEDLERKVLTLRSTKQKGR